MLIILLVILILILGIIFVSQKTKNTEINMDTDEKVIEVIEENADIDEEDRLSPGTPSMTKEFSVNGEDFFFSLKEIKVNVGDTVKINFTNTGRMPHDLVIDEFDGAKTDIINNGVSQTIQFVADKAGTFEYYCSVGSHRQMGMVGNLIVE